MALLCGRDCARDMASASFIFSALFSSQHTEFSRSHAQAGGFDTDGEKNLSLASDPVRLAEIAVRAAARVLSLHQQ